MVWKRAWTALTHLSCLGISLYLNVQGWAHSVPQGSSLVFREYLKVQGLGNRCTQMFRVVAQFCSSKKLMSNGLFLLLKSTWKRVQRISSTRILGPQKGLKGSSICHQKLHKMYPKVPLNVLKSSSNVPQKYIRSLNDSPMASIGTQMVAKRFSNTPQKVLKLCPKDPQKVIKRFSKGT